jgi:hypothetical protein
MQFKRGTFPVCPHCNATYEDRVEDFTIPGRIGYESMAEEQCVYCDKSFTVEQIDADTFEVVESVDE